MQNFDLPLLPNRPEKPREKGLSMVMDKGICFKTAESMLDLAGHLIDYIKLGFGTSLVSNHIEKKIKLYHDANTKVYVGGTLFEAFLVRNKLDDYKRYIDKLGLHTIEISDGSMIIEPDQKLEMIQKFAKEYHVLSEIGSKDADVELTDEQWIKSMQDELQAGSSLVIAEARESGNVGIYGKDGKANSSLIQKLSQNINPDKILWEAPNKTQQVWFIKEFGTNVNLGNIAFPDIVSLETLRLGLRGDTFFDFLPENLQQLKIPATK